MTASCWGQRYFSCRVLNSSSWANNQSNRGRLTGECVQSLLYEYLFGGRENSDPQRHRGAEGYKPFPSWEDSQVVRRLQRAGKAYPMELGKQILGKQMFADLWPSWKRSFIWTPSLWRREVEGFFLSLLFPSNQTAWNQHPKRHIFGLAKAAFPSQWSHNSLES